MGNQKIKASLLKKGLSVKHIFLIDAIGALTTALLLSQLLAPRQELFGMPEPIVMLLAALATVFALYSFSMFIQQGKRSKLKLKIIALANLFYCLLTLALMVRFHEVLTLWGLLYFSGEIVIVASLGLFELKTSSRQIV